MGNTLDRRHRQRFPASLAPRRCPMPWSETTPMSQRRRFIHEYSRGNGTMSDPVRARCVGGWATSGSRSSSWKGIGRGRSITMPAHVAVGDRRGHGDAAHHRAAPASDVGTPRTFRVQTAHAPAARALTASATRTPTSTASSSRREWSAPSRGTDVRHGRHSTASRRNAGSAPDK